MDITSLRQGERAEVLSVEAPPALKERLKALNLREGSEVLLLKISPFRATFLVQTGSMVALRREVAECVKVTKKQMR